MKKIGVLTRDCAGINAAIRAVVRLMGSLRNKMNGDSLEIQDGHDYITPSRAHTYAHNSPILFALCYISPLLGVAHSVRKQTSE